jgi:hypothetical protein
MAYLLDLVNLQSAEVYTDPATLVGHKWEEDGKTFIYARAASTLTALTPYRVHYAPGVAASCPSVGAITDGAFMNLVAIPLRDVASGDWDAFQIGGLVANVILPSADYTATYALRIMDAAIAQIAAVPTGLDTCFGFVESRASTGAVALATIYLFGREALGAT